jgi:bifunctional non-homologous end joining protein LigD
MGTTAQRGAKAGARGAKGSARGAKAPASTKRASARAGTGRTKTAGAKRAKAATVPPTRGPARRSAPMGAAKAEDRSGGAATGAQAPSAPDSSGRAARRAPSAAKARAAGAATRTPDRATRVRTRDLAEYDAKRDFTITAEPPARRIASTGPLRFFIQRHAARRLHYDFRLELDGALKSWAVPRGPSLDPGEKRLAVHVEDHPIDYGEFEGTIPEKQYGAGDVLLWDRGVWSPVGDAAEGLRRGKLEFHLDGVKLHGLWKLVRMGGRQSEGAENWLLLKGRDAFAAAGDAAEITVRLPDSVKNAGSRALAPDGKSPRERKAATTAGAASPAKRGRTTRAPLPPFAAPQLATLVDAVPTTGDWIYEVKYDGYRMLARIEGGSVRFFSRNGRDWSAKVPHLVRALAARKLPDAWLDGEIVMLDDAGRTSFQQLQNALDGAAAANANIVYFVFDVLHADGEDLRAASLLERKRALDRLVPASLVDGPLRRSMELDAVGADALAAACRLGLEGLIGKRTDAAYVSGRSPAWIKLKCGKRQEFVIGGWTEGARAGFGALLVGTAAADGRLDYAGRVGTGFDGATIDHLKPRFAALETDASPFRAKLPGPGRWSGGRPGGKVHWLRPQLVAEVAYTELTDEGILRHPSFQGLREDKDPRTVRPERAAPVEEATGNAVAGIRITHPDRVLYADNGVTKLELARYHAAVAEHLVPELADRPLSLVRCPDGTAGACFFQKHMDATAPAALKKVRGPDRREYLLANEPAAVVSLVQRGVIELHTWGSRAPKLDRPDRITMDLDPDGAVSWATVVEAALLMRGLLEAMDLVPFLKTTGGKGLHVVAPIRPAHDWDTVKTFTQGLARHLAGTFPDRFTATVTKARRVGKIFVDYLRNGEGATAIAAYAVRARAGAPVSVPLAWDELDPRHDVREAYFNVRNVPGRLAALARDPWADYARSARPLKAATLKKLG